MINGGDDGGGGDGDGRTRSRSSGPRREQQQ